MPPAPRRRRVSLARAGGLLALVVGLRHWVQGVGPFPGDRWAADRLLYRRPRHRLARRAAAFYASLASPRVAVSTTLIAAGTLHRHVGPRAATKMLLSAAVVLWSARLKRRWGPTPLFESSVPEALPNYPSGHTAYATSVLGYIALVGREHDLPEVSGIALLLIAGMAPARLLDGSHLVSDLVGGYMLGAAWLIVVVG